MKNKIIASPLNSGVTLSPLALINREQESEKLYQNLTHGINIALISQRKLSKPNLVEKVTIEIQEKEEGFKIAVVDLFSVSTEEEFFEIFAKEIIKASSNNGEESLTDFPIIDPAEIKRHQDEILNIPEKIAQRKNIKFIVCLNEFQNLTSFPEYESLEKKMRAVWQRQKKVNYCFYGSNRHLMTDIFNNPSKPFYRFGDIMLLSK
ncbi:MAG TPA: hypothetical protein VFM60_06410 [Salinimicrobium sp.]|nr:hypothetical protein [Salinimicrobium sp.]